MNPPEQPRGNFVMNLNFKRSTNAKAPAITGRVSTPEDPTVEYSFEAFDKKKNGEPLIDSSGNPYWIGPVDMNRSLRGALHAKPEDGTHFVVIRENGFRIFKELPDGSLNPEYANLHPDQQALENAKPCFWGNWTRTAADPVLDLAAFDREPGRYGPWASGSTQHHQAKDIVKEALPKGGRRSRSSQPEAAAHHEPFMDETGPDHTI